MVDQKDKPSLGRQRSNAGSEHRPSASHSNSRIGGGVSQSSLGTRALQQNTLHRVPVGFFTSTSSITPVPAFSQRNPGTAPHTLSTIRKAAPASLTLGNGPRQDIISTRTPPLPITRSSTTNEACTLTRSNAIRGGRSPFAREISSAESQHTSSSSRSFRGSIRSIARKFSQRSTGEKSGNAEMPKSSQSQSNGIRKARSDAIAIPKPRESRFREDTSDW